MDMIFFCVVLLGVCVLFFGCDLVIIFVIFIVMVIVLDGKMMGIFWWVSVIGVDEVKVLVLCVKVQVQLDVDDCLLLIWKNDLVLMCFNYVVIIEFWLVSEVMVDIVILLLWIGVKMYGVMDIIVGLLVNLWGFGLDKQLVIILDVEVIVVVKVCIGLQYLQVINQSGRQFL